MGNTIKIINNSKIKSVLNKKRRLIFYVYRTITIAISMLLVWFAAIDFDFDYVELTMFIILPILIWLEKYVDSSKTIKIKNGAFTLYKQYHRIYEQHHRYQCKLTEIINIRIVDRDWENYSVIFDYRRGESNLTLFEKLDKADAIKAKEWLEMNIQKSHNELRYGMENHY